MLKISRHEMRFESRKYIKMRLQPGLYSLPGHHWPRGAYGARSDPLSIAARTFVVMFIQIVSVLRKILTEKGIIINIFELD